ncbi:MAG: hypothetical protein K0Q43_4103 [Ramlibacter sp.]|jgi:predicted Fe-S protein YdhL (DUF1289 family)|nr:hypothetical protein [Ramlibacter sp.]
MAATGLLAKRARQVVAGLCDEVPSPCVSVCRMDPVSELCEGCFRTLDEIALWGRMEEGSKREVWRQIGQRIAMAQADGERKHV